MFYLIMTEFKLGFQDATNKVLFFLTLMAKRMGGLIYECSFFMSVLMVVNC